MFPFIKLSDILNRLRYEIEDIKFFLENPYPLSREEIQLWLLRATVLIKALSEILNRSLQESLVSQTEILKIGKDTFDIVEALLNYLENQYPLFLETITVFYEPLPKKIKQLKKTFKETPEEVSVLDLDELAFLTEEIANTLEIFISNLQKVEEKFYN
jgi:hypothetical protein